MTQMSITQALTTALQLQQAGRLAEAESIYRQILAAEPNHPDALHLLGMIASACGQHQPAIELISRSLALNPNFPDAHFNLGNVFAAAGLHDRAIPAYQQAIAQRPVFASAYCNLGVALLRTNRSDEAIFAFRRATEQDSSNAHAWYDLGLALQGAKRLDEAVQAYRAALAVRPDYPEAFNNLGNVLREMDRLDEALDAYRQAMTLQPIYPVAENNRAETLKDLGKVDLAVEGYQRALRSMPDMPEAHTNLAMARLLEGRLADGWPEYEWRWKTEEFRPTPRFLSHPKWDGTELNGRRILLHYEQGLGDTIQFCRYAPLVAARGGHVILLCQPELQNLLANFDGVAELVASRDQADVKFDLQCPLLSLPLCFGATLNSIPSQVPYLRADPARSRDFKAKLEQTSGLKIGLAWAGRPTHKKDRTRSLALQALAPLAKVSGVRFFSLQKGAAADQAHTPPPGMELIDWTSELNDFTDTAALIDNLDLVIAVDTVVAHLAGAMGKAVWVLLPFSPDWRWMLHRTDSPWYPTMRLFRQPAPGDWTTPIEHVSSELDLMARQKL